MEKIEEFYEDFNMENDIIITIKKDHSENILKGKKTYEFRKYIPKTGIKRIWGLIMDLKKVYMHII